MPPKGERRKHQIVNTAKDMFIEKGFQSTHIGQVCEKLNIARGTVYQYFSNKKEILYAILYSVIERIEDIFDFDDLQEFFKTNPDGEQVLVFISKRISGCISVLVNEPIVIKLVYKEIVGIDSEVIDKVNESLLKIAKIIGREVKEIKTRGIYKQNIDPEITSSMIVGGVMMLVYEYEKKNLNILDKTVVESITDNYLRGIMANF
ncbi:MAG: TetR/AcrR family transcriptional regulator [Spirochaetes bacterium]|nr:TetR/AcrR family transcriptional regulator [Spirochaetota bacterium]